MRLELENYTNGINFLILFVLSITILSCSFTEVYGINKPYVTLYQPSVSGLKVTINGVTQPNTQGATITKIDWNWGDNQTTTGWFPQTHQYAQAGTYIVTALVTDSNGLTGLASTSVTLPLSAPQQYYPVWQGWQGPGYYEFVAHNFKTGYVSDVCELNAINLLLTGKDLAAPYDPNQISACLFQSKFPFVNSTELIINAINQLPPSSPLPMLPQPQKSAIVEDIQGSCSPSIGLIGKLNRTEQASLMSVYGWCASLQTRVKDLNYTLNNIINGLNNKIQNLTDTINEDRIDKAKSDQKIDDLSNKALWYTIYGIIATIVFSLGTFFFTRWNERRQLKNTMKLKKS